MKIIFIAIFLFGFPGSIFAAKAKHEGLQLPECQALAAACEKADYIPGEHKAQKTGLWIDCVGRVAKGETVNGVAGFTVLQAQECQKAHESWKTRQRAAKALKKK